MLVRCTFIPTLRVNDSNIRSDWLLFGLTLMLASITNLDIIWCIVLCLLLQSYHRWTWGGGTQCTIFGITF